MEINVGVFNFSKKKEATSADMELNKALKDQDKQIDMIRSAEGKYEKDGNIDALILFWEQIWLNGGLLFNGSKWTFRLPDLYIKQNRYNDALRILRKIKNPQYADKKKSYIEKIQKLAAPKGKSKSRP